MPVRTALIDAIKSHSIVRFHDGRGYQRIGEPHLLGVCSETGEIRVEMLQTDGESARQGSPLPEWRRFPISEIWNLCATAITFTPRQEFTPHSPVWAQVIASVGDSPAPNA